MDNAPATKDGYPRELAEEHGSEIETGAREAIAEDFGHIAAAYGFDADVEELIATRDW